MKEQLKMLLALQKVDLEADAIQDQKDALDDRLDEIDQVVEQLSADLEGQREELVATELLQAEKVKELGEVKERYKESKGRLSRVSNTKEYAAIELEIENAKRQTATLEEELVQLGEAIEATRAATVDKAAKVKSLSAEIDGERGRADAEIVKLNGRLRKLDGNRSGMTTGLKKSILRQYEFIRSRRDGRALAPATNGCCQVCFMQLPAQLYIELQRAESFKRCPTCQTILYFESADLVEEAQ